MRIRGFNLANPLTVYTLLWVTVVVLASLRLTTQLLAPNERTILLVAANIGTFALVYALLALRYPKAPSPDNVRANPAGLWRLRHLIKRLLAVWAIGTAIEAVIAGGIPLFWLLTGDVSKDYRDFGVSTLHGLFTAMYLFSLTGLYLDYCIRRRRPTLALVIALLVWPVLLVNRGVLIWAVLELACVYVVLNRVGIRRIALVAVSALTVIVLFGAVGDLRLGANRAFLASVVAPSAQHLMSILPSGFLWVYIYITSPINNVVAGINTLKPNYVIYYSVVNLVPTVIRNFVYSAGPGRYPLQLVNEGFNTSTWYAGFLSDVGIGGAILIVAFLQTVAAWLYMYARRGGPWAILAYAAAFEGIALSIFADTFTSLVTVAQIVIALYLWARTRRFQVA